MAADDIVRIVSAFIPNTSILAAQVNAELNQFISNTNQKASRLVDNTFSGNNTFTGTVAFNSTVTFANTVTYNSLMVDTLSEVTPGHGVIADSVTLKDGMVIVSGTPTTNGQIGYTSNLLQAYINGSVKTIATTDSIGLPKGYLSSRAPIWQSVSTVRVPQGFKCRNDADTADITVSANIDVVLSASGAAGLATGSEASNTWYDLWVCSGSSGTTAIFSTSGTAPTLPTGYTTNKRLIPGNWRNDNSSNIINQYYVSFGPISEIRYRCLMQGFGGTVGPTNILDGGTSGSYSSFADLTATPNFVGPSSNLGIFKVDSYGNVYSIALRPNGYTSDDYWVRSTTGTNQPVQDVDYIPTDSSRLIELKTSSGDGVDIAVVGYVTDQYNNGLT